MPATHNVTAQLRALSLHLGQRRSELLRHAVEAVHIDLQQRKDAAEHGTHRWQQGYDVRETMREWGYRP